MMRHKRHLPHWLPEEAVLHVTWRLAESRREYRLHAGPSGSKWLADERIADIVVNALKYGAEQKRFYDLFAYVVMSNHVHVVIQPHVELSEIMRWLKGG